MRLRVSFHCTAKAPYRLVHLLVHLYRSCAAEVPPGSPKSAGPRTRTAQVSVRSNNMRTMCVGQTNSPALRLRCSLSLGLGVGSPSKHTYFCALRKHFDIPRLPLCVRVHMDDVQFRWSHDTMCAECLQRRFR